MRLSRLSTPKVTPSPSTPSSKLSPLQLGTPCPSHPTPPTHSQASSLATLQQKNSDSSSRSRRRLRLRALSARAGEPAPLARGRLDSRHAMYLRWFIDPELERTGDTRMTMRNSTIDSKGSNRSESGLSLIHPRRTMNGITKCELPTAIPLVVHRRDTP